MNSAKKKGLGRGLSALFGDIEKKSESNQTPINKISIADLQRNKYQPRTIFDQETLDELSSSIKENGVIQPIAVRPNKYEPGKYEIVAGERRWLAAQKAGLNEVPVVVLDIDDQKSLEIAIVENVQRQGLWLVCQMHQKLLKISLKRRLAPEKLNHRQKEKRVEKILKKTRTPILYSLETKLKVDLV